MAIISKNNGIIKGTGNPNLDVTIQDGDNPTPIQYIDVSTIPQTIYRFDDTQVSGSKWVEDLTIVSEELVLRKVDEGNGLGITINGRNLAKFGTLGLNAIDLSEELSSDSTTRGATGQSSFAIGSNTTASGDWSFASGVDCEATGYCSTAIGEANTATSDYCFSSGLLCDATGANSASIGFNCKAASYSSMVVGVFPTLPVSQSALSYVATDELFKVGNGVNSGSRSNALLILKNGTITAPSATTALINTAGSKAVITKEYLDQYLQSLTGYNAGATQTLKHVSGVLQWVTD